MPSPVHALRRVLESLALAALLVALALPSPVAAHAPDPMLSNVLFAQNQALDYKWGTGATPPSVIRTAINAAAGDSNASKRSKAPVYAYDSAASNTISYGVDVPCGVNGLACFSRNAPAGFKIWLRENGHRYDWGTLRWCEMTGDPNGCYEAETITLDELGHVHGLDHHVNFADDSDYADAVVQQYSHVKPQVGWNAHVFGRCDIAALQQAYDVASATTLYSTCLDVPSLLTLAASKTSVVAGSVVSFTATLTSAGTGRLSNNTVNSRVVVLQQRTATGWADVLTMTPGTGGLYTAGLVMWSTRDVRAVFRKPSNEGLRGDSSPYIAIAVTAACTSGLCPQGGGPMEAAR